MHRKYPEENLARDFHRQMVQQFPQLSPTVSGMGVHWHCEIAHGERSCTINCFDNLAGPQYLTAYQRDGQLAAYSRTAAREPLLTAVAAWLEGTTLAAMYARFEFVDQNKRRLIKIRDDAYAAEPALVTDVESELINSIADHNTLMFRNANRACEITFHADNRWPDARFSWDECQLFQYKTHDASQFASVLKCWLCDVLKPSQMRAHFPWLTIDELADYYEAGNPVEGEFLKSWDHMQQFYVNSQCPQESDIRALISAMRMRGYDKTLRAGQSLWTLILSRSRRHGMRAGQPYIQFFFHDDGMNVVYSMVAEHDSAKISKEKIAFTQDLEALLEKLQSMPID